MSSIIVTSNPNPDLDGFASAVAYAEFLNKTGTPAGVRIFGEPHMEAKFILRKFGFTIEEDKLSPPEMVVLVDASDARVLDGSINPESVIEVIDHRRINNLSSLKNAKAQIELVGAAATLIAEKFHNQNIAISAEAATLLYGAIVSNTLNFRGGVTTDRDRNMADWLNKKLKLTPEFIDEMFRAKSDVSDRKLAERIEEDFNWFEMGSQKVGIAQLEIMDVRPLLDTRQAEILNILQNLKSQKGLDKIFISFIDLGENFNAFLVDDPSIKSALITALGVSFVGDVAFRPGYIMRKELAPLLKEKIY